MHVSIHFNMQHVVFCATSSMQLISCFRCYDYPSGQITQFNPVTAGSCMLIQLAIITQVYAVLHLSIKAHMQ